VIAFDLLKVTINIATQSFEALFKEFEHVTVRGIVFNLTRVEFVI